LVQITKDEADFLREQGIFVTKTCKLKRKGGRGKHYCEDSKKTASLLAEYRKNH